MTPVKGTMFENRPLMALALAAILGPFGFASCAVTSTPQQPPPPTPAFESVGPVQPLGVCRVARFRDTLSGQEYLIVTHPGFDIAVAAVPK